MKRGPKAETPSQKLARGTFQPVRDAGKTEIIVPGDRFLFVDANGGNPIQAMTYENGTWKMRSIQVDTITYGSLVPKFGGEFNSINPDGGFQIMPGGLIMQWGRLRQTIADEASFSVIFPMPFPNNVMAVTGTAYIDTPDNERDLWIQNVGVPTVEGATFYCQSSTSNSQLIQGIDWHAFGN